MAALVSGTIPRVTIRTTLVAGIHVHSELGKGSYPPYRSNIGIFSPFNVKPSPQVEIIIFYLGTVCYVLLDYVYALTFLN